AQRPGFLVAASRFAAWSVKLGLKALGIFLIIFPGVYSIFAVAGSGEVAVAWRAARPRRRIPQLRPHEGFGTVIEGFLDSDDDDHARPLAANLESLQQLRVRADRRAAGHAIGFVRSRDHENDTDLPVDEQVLHPVDAVIARPVGD